jgi:TetR/AcrR family transcriptional repressor of mexJK operon
MPVKKIAKAVTDSPKRDSRAVQRDSRTEQLTQRLLEAATQLFLEKGYDATSMAEISAAAHASKETFYRHFPTKDNLFRAVVIRRAEMIAADLSTILVATDPPKKALTVFGERILSRMITKDTIAFHRLLGMTRERFPEILQLYRTTGPFRIRDAVTEYLKVQIREGKLRKLNPEVAARQFFDLAAAEMIMNASITGKPNPSKAEMKQRVKEAVDCFLHGYAA